MLRDFFVWEASNNSWDFYQIHHQPERWLLDLMACKSTSSRINSEMIEARRNGGPEPAPRRAPTTEDIDALAHLYPDASREALVALMTG